MSTFTTSAYSTPFSSVKHHLTSFQTRHDKSQHLLFLPGRHHFSPRRYPQIWVSLKETNETIARFGQGKILPQAGSESVEEGNIGAADARKLAVQPALGVEVVCILTEKLFATVHMVRTEGDSGTLGNEDGRFSIRTTAFGEQCCSDGGSGVHRDLWVESQCCNIGLAMDLPEYVRNRFRETHFH